jgi:hypothetical protein
VSTDHKPSGLGPSGFGQVTKLTIRNLMTEFPELPTLACLERELVDDEKPPHAFVGVLQDGNSADCLRVRGALG